MVITTIETLCDEATAAQRKLLASSSGFGWHTVVYCIARASR